MRAEDQRALEEYIMNLTNPYGIPIEFRFLDGKKEHLSEKRAVAYERPSIGDVQKVDFGIAMAYFELSAGENGIDGKWKTENSGLLCPEDTEYIISFSMTKRGETTESE